MPKTSEYLPKDDDSTHYKMLGRGLTDRLRSGINYARETLSNVNERVDRAVEGPFLNLYKKVSNNPASNKWVGRHKGDLLETAAILTASAITGHFAGKAADAVVSTSGSTGRTVVSYGSPSVLKEIITIVNDTYPLGYTLPTKYFPENIGKNGAYYGLGTLTSLSSFFGGIKLGKCLFGDAGSEV